MRKSPTYADQVTIAHAHSEYERLKTGAGHSITVPIIAKRYGLSPNHIYNFRRGLSPRKTNSKYG